MTDWLLIDGRWWPESKVPNHESEADAIRRATARIPKPPAPPPSDPEATAAAQRILDARQPDPEGPGC